MATSHVPIPVTVLTGFLGSGKTTLLNRWSETGLLRGALIVINEFGSVGIDHDLVEESTESPIVELASGCLCCTIRGDLVRTLGAAVRRSQGKRGKRFERVVIETTGLADPAPVLHTLMTHPELTPYYRLDGVVTTVDAVNGMSTLDRFSESVKQAAVADRIIMTKEDLADAASLTAVRLRLARLNPPAIQHAKAASSVLAEDVFDLGLYNPRTKSIDVQRWLQAEAYTADDHDRDHHGHAHAPHASAGHSHHEHRHDEHLDRNRHDDLIRSFCLWEEEPISDQTLDIWLRAIARLAGPDLLRVKGLVNVAGYAAPWVIHGVQHLFHPPVMLRRWPSAERRSRIVFIVRDLLESDLRGALHILRSFEPS